MDEIIYKLPKGIELSQYQREKAICGAYFKVMLSGLYYYIPFTKEMKKRFGFIERKGKLIPTNYKAERELFEITQSIIDCVYLQIRDVVCAGIEESLDQNLREGFSELFKKFIHRKVNEKINLRLENKIKKE